MKPHQIKGVAKLATGWIKLRLLREEHNLSQIELAKKVGITERTIYNYETNDRIPKIDVVTKIAHVFGVR